MNKTKTARNKVITAMGIYGTIGIFVRYIPFASAVTSMLRGVIAVPFLLIVLLFKRSAISWSSIKANLLPLCVSGVMLGVNWAFLFEAYRYTTVATATLCYYFAPIFIVIASPFFFGEKMTVRKTVCVITALIGMVFVSGVAENGLPAFSEIKGVLLGVGAAVLYAAIIITNKKMHDISPYDRTIVQLAISSIALLPYNLLTGGFETIVFTPLILGILLFIGIVHTGIAYLFYFGSVEHLKSQTLAILSYIDPVVAILLSALLLKESLGIYGIIGAALILGSACISELPARANTK